MAENNHFEKESSKYAAGGNVIRDSQLRLAILIGNLKNVVLYETGGGREFVTQNIFHMLGFPPEKFTEDRKFFTSLIHPEDAKKMDLQLDEWYKNGSSETLKLEFRCNKSNGEIIWLEDYLNLINPAGDKPYISGLLIDITERKESENLIKKSLQEKEVLLKEIHHRVNNNLQVISSLLKIQSYYAEKDTDKEIFKETLNRIRSMAVIHQLTCKSNNLAKIELNTYLIELTKYLGESYHKKNIQFNVNSDEIISINTDIAIPCGLLINELTSLILNHCGENGKGVSFNYYVKRNLKTGEIIITLHCKNCNTLSEKMFDEKTLGLQLVNTLNEQIDGKLETDYSNGIIFIVTFKDNQYPERLS